MSDTEEQKLFNLVLVGRIAASLAGICGESFNNKIKFCFHHFSNRENIRSAVPFFFFLLCVKYSGFFWWVGGGICSQVVRDLPFIDSIFGGNFKRFQKGKVSYEIAKKK